MITDHVFNADRLIEFLEVLIKDAHSKTFPILDNLRVPHLKPVKAWVADHAGLIEAFYLPSYAPESAHDERLGADLKHTVGARLAARTKAKLESAAEAHRPKSKHRSNASKRISKTPMSATPRKSRAGSIRHG